MKEVGIHYYHTAVVWTVKDWGIGQSFLIIYSSEEDVIHLFTGKQGTQ